MGVGKRIQKPDGSQNHSPVCSAPAMEISGADFGGACISFQLEEERMQEQ